MDIREEIGTAACLEQLAEEATELAKAALKYARVLRKENPTPVTEDEIKEHLVEEYTDLMVCIGRLDGICYINYGTYMNKLDRWVKRIEEAKNVSQNLHSV